MAPSDSTQSEVLTLDDDAYVVEPGEKKIETKYRPRPLQYRLHQEIRRFNVLVTHRRFGKSVWDFNHLKDRAIKHHLPMPRYAFIANTYGQAERVIWDYAKMYTRDLPGAKINQAKLTIDLPHNNARIMLLSAENLTSLPGIYLDGVVLDEYGMMNPVVWTKVIRPMLSDRRGWAIFSGTFEGLNHFHELYQYAKSGVDKDWAAWCFKASETGIIPKEELEALKREMPEEEFLEQYECEPAGIRGAYFTKELAEAERDGRIGVVPYEPKLPVDTYWDLGINDTTVVWFVQNARGDLRVIDYYEVSGLGLKDSIPEVLNKGYVMGEWVLPHDVEVRDLSTGNSRIEQFWSLGIKNTRVVPRVGNKMEGINAARTTMRKCRWDAERCKNGLNALRNYKRKWNDKNQCYDKAPLHNWASNGADAFQTLGLGLQDNPGQDILFEQAHQSPHGLRAHGRYNPSTIWRF